jgi:hypothetical protein
MLKCNKNKLLYCKIYHMKNKKYINERQRKYRLKYKKEIKERRYQYYLKHKNKINKYRRKYYYDHIKEIKKYRLKNKDKINKRWKKYYNKNKVKIKQKQKQDPARYLWWSCRANDKQKGRKCNLTINWIKENIISKPCIYCGDTKNISCDRIDNNKGHTKNNVVSSCLICNLVRNNIFSPEEMKLLGPIIKQIKEQRKK